MLRFKRRAKAKMILLREGSWHLRWIFISSTLALAGFIGLSATVPVWVQLMLGLISVGLVCLDIWKHQTEIRGTEFQPRSTEHFTSITESMQRDDRYDVHQFRHGTLVIDLDVSLALRSNEFKAKAADTAYILRPEIRAVGNRYRRARVNRNPNAYNEPVLGLSEIIGCAPVTSLSTVDAYYWDHLATDHLAMVDTKINTILQTDLGRSLFIDRHDKLRTFGASWLLNAIGVSVMAITTDGHFVVVMQSANNDSSMGLYAPTGSGSLEPQDYQGEVTLPASKLFANGAMREAAEESAITHEDVEEVLTLGFGRWLEKAAKPEVFLVAFLSIDSHAVRRKRVPTPDRPYTSSTTPHRFKQENPLDWRSNAPSNMVSDDVKHSLSLPLEACLALLAAAVERRETKICKMLEPRLNAIQ